MTRNWSPSSVDPPRIRKRSCDSFQWGKNKWIQSIPTPSNPQFAPGNNRGSLELTAFHDGNSKEESVLSVRLQHLTGLKQLHRRHNCNSRQYCAADPEGLRQPEYPGLRQRVFKKPADVCPIVIKTLGLKSDQTIHFTKYKML